MEPCFARRMSEKTAGGTRLEASRQLSLLQPDARMDLSYQCQRTDECHWRGAVYCLLSFADSEASFWASSFHEDLFSPLSQVPSKSQCCAASIGHGLVTQRACQNEATQATHSQSLASQPMTQMRLIEYPLNCLHWRSPQKPSGRPSNPSFTQEEHPTSQGSNRKWDTLMPGD